jgi:hypothetical protein
VDSSGWLANFESWVVKDATSGGPGWIVLLDRSPLPTAVPFTVNTIGAQHLLDATGHGYYTGEIVQVSNSGGSLPSGLNASQDYVVYKVNNDQFRLCYYMASAWDGTGTVLYNTGSGTQYAQMEGPYIVVSDQSSPTINQPAMIMKAGYKILESGKIRTQYALSFDTTNKILYGYWGGFGINTVDSGSYSYDFRGGAECMIAQSRIGSSWSTSMVDSWLGDSNFVEGTDKIGTLAGDATARTNKVLQLGVGEAANFTPNRYYYIYDMTGHAWVNYVKVTADDTVAHTITVDSIDKNFPTGSVIAAYAHRYYCAGNILVSGDRFNALPYAVYSSIPYCSSQVSARTFSNQNSPIYEGVTGSIDTVTLNTLIPNDRGFYACQKPFLVEKSNHEPSSFVGMTEGLGIMKNLYATYAGTMVQGLDGKTVGGANWLYFQPFSSLIYTGVGGIAAMFMDSTSLV